uniref:Laminin IV type A domain-containing protein n=1 Tax=Octopus bimaculoides TaxID=37653 RepID=A0A0L8I2C7_OCTBM
MLVTSNKYAPELLVFQPIDKSADFLSECIDDSLNLKEGKEKLKSCRTRFFALTTDYNNGALYCNCEHSSLTWYTISDMKNWTLPNTVDAIIEEGSSEISAIINLVEDEKKPLYWSAPYTYLSNKIISYGGQLKYSVEFDTYDDGEMVEGTPDVILMGNNTSLVHSVVSETDQTEYTVDLRFSSEIVASAPGLAFVRVAHKRHHFERGRCQYCLTGLRAGDT